MRKNNTLLITFALVSILLAGCVGGGTGIISPNPPIGSNPPITTEPDAIFDGSPTHLVLEFERQGSGIQTLGTLEQTQNIAYVTLYRYEGNVVVYSFKREFELEPGQSIFSLESELPAEMNYVVDVIVVGENNRFIEYAFRYETHAPANTITTQRVVLQAPTADYVIPEKMYSGGSTRQFSANSPERWRNYFVGYIWVGMNPWDRNGTSGLWSANPDGKNPTGWIAGRYDGYVPEVEEPTKLYYQTGIMGPTGMLPEHVQRPELAIYYPDLKQDEELPYIWIYPYPGWADENPGWQPE